MLTCHFGGHNMCRPPTALASRDCCIACKRRAAWVSAQLLWYRRWLQRCQVLLSLCPGSELDPSGLAALCSCSWCLPNKFLNEEICCNLQACSCAIHQNQQVAWGRAAVSRQAIFD